jgi:hypothetical protein
LASGSAAAGWLDAKGSVAVELEEVRKSAGDGGIADARVAETHARFTYPITINANRRFYRIRATR